MFGKNPLEFHYFMAVFDEAFEKKNQLLIKERVLFWMFATNGAKI